MRTSIIIGLVLAGASADAAERLRLADAIAEARARNPALAAAHARATAAAAVPTRVRALDDPTFSYELWNAPDFRPDRADNNIFRLGQKLPFPGKRALAGDVAARDADVAGADVAGAELELDASVRRAFYDLWGAHELEDVYGRERAIVERLAHVAEQKYAVGEVAQSDVLRAQVELTRVVTRHSTQALAIDAARAELNALLSRDPDEPLGAPEAPPAPRLAADAATLAQTALASRPEIRSSEAAVAREEAAVRLARRQYYPDVELNVGRFVNPGRRDGFGAMATVTIPIAYKGKYDAGVAEAEARLASARAELRRVQDAVRRDVTQAFVRARTALVQRNLLVSTHLPQAEQSLRVAESGYQTGAVDFLALTDTARTVESAHVEHVMAEVEFEKASADLDRAVGKASEVSR
jgi:outer membrane protein, heavy metal efflux system